MAEIKLDVAFDKIQYLFGKGKWRGHKESEYYLDVVTKEPGNTVARLRLAEIYQKRGEKKKALFQYFMAAEIFSRKRLYPQALAIYKRIQKQEPTLSLVYPKLSQIFQKMGFQEKSSSPPPPDAPQKMKESIQEAGVPMADPRSPNTITDEKVQGFKGTPKVQTETGGNGSSTRPLGMAFPAPEKKDVLFDLGAELEVNEPLVCKESEEVTTEKSYGFEEILKELKRTHVPSKAYPDLNYNMGVACREMGFIDEAIEQFHIAFGAGQKPLEAAYLLGLCFLDKGQPIEARQSFEKALKVEGASTDKLREIELTLIGVDQKREEGFVEFLNVNKVGGPQPKASFRYQNKKMAFATLGSSLIFTRPPSIIRQTNP